jgi:DNA-binding NarL/FixJ family response regulator
MIRVLVVDDQALIRSGIRAILSVQPDIEVSEATGGMEAVARAASNDIDLILMDIRMPDLDGIEATRQIRSLPRGADLKILVLTTFENDVTVVEAVRAGADGFVGKSVEPDELVHRVRSVAAGHAELSPAATNALVRHVGSVSPEMARIDPRMAALAETLTPRERDIVRAVATGLRNEEIAEAEFISQFTVKTHLNRAMAKAGVNDRGQLVLFAFRSGLAEQH